MATRRSLFLPLCVAGALLLALLGHATPVAAQAFIESGRTAEISADEGCVIIRTQRLGGASIALAGTFTAQLEIEVNNRDDATVATCATGNGWAAKEFTPSDGGSGVSSLTSAGAWDGSISGYLLLRVRASSFSSGPVEVTIATGQGGGTGGGGAGGGAGGDVNIDAVGGVTVTDNLPVECVVGCSGGTTDTDDASVATGQSTGLAIGLQHAFDGSVWRRVTFGTAGTAAAQVWSVQGIAGMTALQVANGGTFATQAAQSGTWNITNVSGTVSLPTGAATAANQSTGNTSVGNIDTDLGSAAAAADNTSNPTLGGLRAFHMLFDGATWDRAPGDSTNGALVNLGANNDVDTELPAAGAAADGASNPTAPGVLAYMQCYNGSTWDRCRFSQDGLSIYRSLDLDESEEEIKATAGTLYGAWFTNTATATRWLKCYNATAANVTVGTTTPVITLGLPGNSSDDISGALSNGGAGITFSTAITCAATTAVADNDTGAPGANDVVINFFFR